jgi:uncharacterized protein (UPF0210 family)
MPSRCFRALLVLCAFATAAFAAPTTTRPNVRTLTAFVRIDRVQYAAELAEAKAFLDQARALFQAQGWVVESVRITTQPFPQYVLGLSEDDAVAFLKTLDGLAVSGGYGLNIGPAMRADGDDPAMMRVLARFLVTSQTTNASAHIATMLPSGPAIQWGVIAASVQLIRAVANGSPEGQANFNFAATSLVDPDVPFYPASWHDGPGKRFSVGLESANVVAQVFAATGYNPSAAATQLRAELGAHAMAVETLAKQAAAAGGWLYLGLDSTPAPFDQFASIGAGLESFSGRPFGSSGTLTGAKLITAAVKSLPVHLVGFQGLMLPILEDSRLAQRFGEGHVSIDGLLSYSAVCGTGLDDVPLPGDVTDDQLTRILGDVASLSAKWQKPLTARLLPVPGRHAGDATAFQSPFLTNTILQPLP